MHSEGAEDARPTPSAMPPVTDDEIREKYLERAIRELNTLGRDVHGCQLCPRGDVMPVLGSGHPQADVLLLKWAPTSPEVSEGVAFYGRAGNALQKALKRLQIDPLAVYGTLCVKCPVEDPAEADPGCQARVGRELAIVAPRMVVVMGTEALACLNDLAVPLSSRVEPALGQVQRFTPTCDALFTPDIDESLDEDVAKRAFWSAFRALGDWWADLPPY